MKSSVYTILILLIFTVGCVKDDHFTAPESFCDKEMEANASFEMVKSMYKGELIQIQEDLIISGYVVSSDRAGNFFGSMHIQDKLSDAGGGIELDIDLLDYYLQYPTGKKVFVKLKGLYLDNKHGVFRLGGVYAAFGNKQVGRLPAARVNDHLFVSCEPSARIQPRVVTLGELKEEFISTLVRIDGLEVAPESLCLPFAETDVSTERYLWDCDGRRINMLNSGYSDFHSEIMSVNSGSITAVVIKDKDEYQLLISELKDVDFSSSRCNEVVFSCEAPDMSELDNISDQIIISEIADPENYSTDANSRFIELSNIGNADVKLDGWVLRRYTNANIDFTSVIDLNGNILKAGASLVIAADMVAFETVYGFKPDLHGGVNSAAGSNGDDNMELVDPQGKVTDVFGVPGEDGSGTEHDFEDGRVVRNSVVTKGNPEYDPSEWTIVSPLSAPDNFTPGIR